MDVVKENMQRTGVAEEDVRDKVRWKQMIHCGDPKGGSRKKKKNTYTLIICNCQTVHISLFSHSGHLV